MNKGQLIATIKTTLERIKCALGHGCDVDLGPKLGRLVVVKRGQKRVIRKNLKGRHPASVVELHRRHPRSVRLVGGKDMSENPVPVVLHPKEPEQTIPARSTHFRVAVPQFRGRPNIPRRAL
jgi:hypothetical protein